MPYWIPLSRSGPGSRPVLGVPRAALAEPVPPPDGSSETDERTERISAARQCDPRARRRYVARHESRSQVACALTGLIGFLLILPAFIIADYFVPPKADWTAQELADFYSGETDRIRVGCLILLVAVVAGAR